MPVTWAFRESVLVLTLTGSYSFTDPIQAVSDAMANPRFQAGVSLLIDARLSEIRRSSEDFRNRSLWMASLLAKGLSPRCGVIVSSAPHQYGMARMASTYLDFQGMTLEIFDDVEKAVYWLSNTTALEPSGGI